MIQAGTKVFGKWGFGVPTSYGEIQGFKLVGGKSLAQIIWDDDTLGQFEVQPAFVSKTMPVGVFAI